MPASQTDWTVEKARALPEDGNRYEVLDGELFVVPWREGGRPESWSEADGLLLAVEVLSPSTVRADRHRKRLIYQDQGVPEYWVVDRDARLVERWRPADSRAEVLAESLEWQPRPGIEPLRIELPAFFDEVLGRA